MPASITDPWAKWTAITDEPLVLAAINRSPDAWLSADAIADETRLPVDRVQMVLDTTPAGVIVAPPGPGRGTERYSTREHYRATTGLLRRYLDALLSS